MTKKRKIRDLAGKRFGSWLVIETYRDYSGKYPRTYAECHCDCGTKSRIRMEKLTSGEIKACIRCAGNKMPNKYIIHDDFAISVICAGGDVFVIDSWVFNKIRTHQWSQSGRYFTTTIKGRRVLLHRFLLGVEDEKNIYVDHISGNTHDNRISNLRLCKHNENMKNQRLNITNTTGYKGVARHSKSNKFVAQISADGKHVYLGLYDNPKDAAAAYDKAALLYHGEFARTNNMMGLI